MQNYFVLFELTVKKDFKRRLATPSPQTDEPFVAVPEPMMNFNSVCVFGGNEENVFG